MSLDEKLKLAESAWLNLKVKSFPYLVGCLAFFLLCAVLLSLLYVKSLKDAERNRLANKALESEIVSKDRDLKKLHAENDAKTKALTESIRRYETTVMDLNRVSSFYTNADWRATARAYELRTHKN